MNEDYFTGTFDCEGCESYYDIRINTEPSVNPLIAEYKELMKLGESKTLQCPSCKKSTIELLKNKSKK